MWHNKICALKIKANSRCRGIQIVVNVNVVNALNRCQFCATDPLQPSGSSLLFQHLSSSEMRSHLVNTYKLYSRGTNLM